MTSDVIKEAVARQQSGDKKVSAERRVLGKVMTFYVGEQVYGVEIENVVEIIEVPHITWVPHLPKYIKGIINVRSKVVPVIDIRLRFGKEEIPYTSRTCTIIMCVDDISVGVIVDSVADVEDIIANDITATPENRSVNTNAFIQYMIRTGDMVKLILDVEKLLGDEV